MQIEVLGPLRALGQGDAFAEVRGRPGTLLAAIVARRAREVPATELLDLVWGEDALEMDVSAVHTVVARLRRAAGAGCVRTTETGYRLGEGVEVDADRFVSLVRRARSATDPGVAVATLREAVRLWRSDTAFDGVPDEVVAHERDQLDVMRAGTEEDLAAALVESGAPGDLADAELLCASLLARHPLRERAYAVRMLAAYHSGRQAEALETYRALARMLRTELGVDPSPATAEVHARILAHDLAPVAVRRLSSAERRRRAHRPPVPLSPLVGRELELGALQSAVSSRRLVTLVGPGGVGKSRLLAELGASMRDDRPVHYLDLSGVSDVDADELVEIVGGGLGLTVPAEGQLEWLVATMAEVTVTVLMDEAEWALGATAALVRALLDGCPGVSVVVTSRRPLGIPGERLVTVAPLACPPQGATAEEVRASPAVLLLSERVTDLAPELDPAAADPTLLAAAARGVDGMPLGLELLAGQAATRTWEELVGLIAEPLELADPDRPEGRHASLRDTVQWSVDRLDDAARHVLFRLGAFSGSFELPAAQAVVGRVDGEVAALVRSLVRDALVQVERDEGRRSFRLLRTVADLARERLEESGDAAATRARHRRWFATRWREAPLSDELVEDVALRYDDYLGALRDALVARDGRALGDLAVTLGRFWLFTEQVGVGLRWTGRALDSGLLDELAEARLVVMRGLVEMQFFRPDVAPQLAVAHATLTRHHDAVWVGMSLIGQLLDRYLSGDPESASGLARELVDLSRAQARSLLPEALAFLATTEVACGRMTAAREAADEAWELAVWDGSATTLVSVAGKLGAALTELGQPQRALDVLKVAEAAYQRGIWQGPWLEASINSAWATLAVGDPAGALRLFARSLAELPRGVSDAMAAECYLGAACALAQVGHRRAPWALAAVDIVRTQAEHVLSPWQEQRLADARAAVGVSLPDLSGDPAPDLSARLGALVAAAAASPDSD